MIGSEDGGVNANGEIGRLAGKSRFMDRGGKGGGPCMASSVERKNNMPTEKVLTYFVTIYRTSKECRHAIRR
jgi:hypothetical protein